MIRLIVMTATAALVLAACGSRTETPPGAPEPSSASLASLGEFDQLGEVVNNADLRPVLEGVGPYTLFAPVDNAFAQARLLGDLSDETMSAQGAAFIREHMAPGILTRADIETAIEASDSGRVEVRTLGEGALTFRREGDILVVEIPGGAQAQLTGEEELVSNGVIQPVSAVLVTPEADTATS